jgi:hypothetical protein
MFQRMSHWLYWTSPSARLSILWVQLARVWIAAAPYVLYVFKICRIITKITGKSGLDSVVRADA